ncbi:hypothetical protein D3C78_1210000 [compost metagenome]
MILGFNKQFVEPILNGSKIHTLREDPNDRWRAGRSIQMATGVRTKNYDCFKEDFCQSTQKVFMDFNGYSVEVCIDNRWLTSPEVRQLVNNDGLTYDDFLDWFFDGRQGRTKWSGKLIHWTDFKY